MGLSSGNLIFKKQTDTFVAPGFGATIDISATPLSNFTILVAPTGAVTLWNVILEGSIDGNNFSPIATHTNLIGANVAIFPGVNSTPCLYFRVNCTTLTLGGGTNIVTTVLGAR